jgi:hypothetical protein
MKTPICRNIGHRHMIAKGRMNDGGIGLTTTETFYCIGSPHRFFFSACHHYRDTTL